MPNPIVAIGAGMLGSSLIGGIAQERSASKAADAQAGASRESIAEQRRQFDAIQALFKPYIEGGTTAFGQQGALIGTKGPAEQQAAIQALEKTPAFKALMRQGEGAILSNASATGGLRGGNVQGALAQFRPNLLAQMIQSQFQNLGGLAQMGQASAAGQAVAGQNTANAVSSALGDIGAANAGKWIARGNAITGVTDSIGQLGMLYGMGAFK